MYPLPKAGPRKSNGNNRRKASTQILTSTPVRDSILLNMKVKAKPTVTEKAAVKKNLFKTSTSKKKTKKTIESESDSDSESDIICPRDSESDAESVQDIMEGDFVVLKVMGKTRSANFIARIDRQNEDGTFDGCFLRKLPSKSTVAPTFVIDECDEGSFGKEDILKILPSPKAIGASARTAGHFAFSCNLQKFDLK